jgi:archaellum component FlaG (FlaF/FlaG flagellin family)
MSLFSDVFSIPAHFELFATLLLTFCLVCLLVKETAKIETGMAEKSSWDQAIIRQKLGLVGEIERKLDKLSKTTFTYRSFS